MVFPSAGARAAKRAYIGLEFGERLPHASCRRISLAHVEFEPATFWPPAKIPLDNMRCVDICFMLSYGWRARAGAPRVWKGRKKRAPRTRELRELCAGQHPGRSEEH